VEIDIDGLRLQGRVADIYPAGLGRVRIGELNGPAVIRHGLDWLLLCAAGQGRELVQFDDRRQAGLGPHLRAPIDVETAREALRRLLQLRAWGLREPLPFAPYTGWTWYEGQTRLDEGASPRANSKTPWERAQEQWHAERGFSEGATDALRLALRGRDPFADEGVGEDFRAIARIVFDAVCHGHDRGGEA
jgi:exodeoxyribonuclease V gamma subunit